MDLQLRALPVEARGLDVLLPHAFSARSSFSSVQEALMGYFLLSLQLEALPVDVRGLNVCLPLKPSTTSSHWRRQSPCPSDFRFVVRELLQASIPLCFVGCEIHSLARPLPGRTAQKRPRWRCSFSVTFPGDGRVPRKFNVR